MTTSEARQRVEQDIGLRFLDAGLTMQLEYLDRCLQSFGDLASDVVPQIIRMRNRTEADKIIIGMIRKGLIETKNATQ